MTTALRTDDVTIPQGTTYRIQWPLTDGDGAPIPLNGYTARAQARKRVDDEEVLESWTTENDGIVLAESTLTLVVNPSDSSAWDWTTAHYDIELVSAEGSVTRITQGRITVSPEVTR